LKCVLAVLPKNILPIPVVNISSSRGSICPVYGEVENWAVKLSPQIASKTTPPHSQGENEETLFPPQKLEGATTTARCKACDREQGCNSQLGSGGEK